MSAAYCAHGQHGLDRARTTRRPTDPTGVGRADDSGAGVGEQNRNAVGGDDGQCKSRRAGHRNVGAVQRFQTVVRPPPRRVPVDLVHPAPWSAGRPIDLPPVAVGRHRCRVVADVVAEVEWSYGARDSRQREWW